MCADQETVLLLVTVGVICTAATVAIRLAIETIAEGSNLVVKVGGAIPVGGSSHALRVVAPGDSSHRAILERVVALNARGIARQTKHVRSLIEADGKVVAIRVHHWAASAVANWLSAGVLIAELILVPPLRGAILGENRIGRDALQCFFAASLGEVERLSISRVAEQANLRGVSIGAEVLEVAIWIIDTAVAVAVRLTVGTIVATDKLSVVPGRADPAWRCSEDGAGVNAVTVLGGIGGRDRVVRIAASKIKWKRSYSISVAGTLQIAIRIEGTTAAVAINHSIGAE